MGTTQEQAGAGQVQQTPEELAAILVGMTLGMRAMWLPRAGNGESVAHSDPAASNISREMADGRSQEWKRIITKKLCDQADGVPTEALVADFEYAIAVFRARAPKLRVDRPWGAVNAAETKAQARLDLAQLRLAEQPTDPTVIREALAARDHYAKVFGEFSAKLRDTLAVTRCATRPPVGRRRGALAMVQS